MTLTPSNTPSVFQHNLWNELRTSLRKLAQTVAPDERLDFARFTCAQLVTAYWKSQVTKNSVTWSVRELSVKTKAFDVALSIVSEMEPLVECLDPEQGSYLIGSLYSALMPEMLRAKDGVFYTPTDIAEHLVTRAEEAGVKWGSARVIDPACGSGVFLLAVAKRIVHAHASLSAEAQLESVLEQLRGVELDPFSAWMSNVFLESLLFNVCVAADTRLANIAICDNALELSYAQHYDLVIGNPPYGKTNLTKEMRSLFSRSLFGHANLYGLFTDLALRICHNHGVIALVTPTSFLGGQYFKALRELITEEAGVTFVDFIDSRAGVFDDVLQETVLTVYSKTAKHTPTKVSLLNDRFGTLIAEYLGDVLVPDSGPWLMPRDKAQAEVVNKLTQLPGRLSTMGYEVVTGQLVWNRHKPQLRYEKLGQSYLPIIWAESVTVNNFEYSASRKNHAPFIAIDTGQEFLITYEPCILMQRTTSKEQTNRLVCGVLDDNFIKNAGGVCIENHLNIIRALPAAKLSLSFVAFVLSTHVVNQAYRCISGSVAVSAYELESLPLPSEDALLTIQEIWDNGKGAVSATAALAKLYAE